MSETTEHRPQPLVGVLVGGRGSRMGGVAKGNLRVPSGERLLERALVEVRAALPTAEVVLVGSGAAYADLGLVELPDAPGGIGPLGGLRALLLAAIEKGHPGALALACDLPYISRQFLSRLSAESPTADYLSPREGELWQPLAARWSVACLPAVEQTLVAGERALQRVVARLGAAAHELPLSAAELAELRDWDEPSDMAR